jgi:geranylgeranyl reductase family protein
VEHQYDVVIIGAGPSGSACAFWLGEAGHDVLLIEKKRFPREKTCGDGLTPRSVKQLNDMGLAGALASHHRFEGLRSRAFGKTLELKWPSHPELPDYGYVVTRHDLDQLVAERAEKSGVTVWQETEALEPIVEGGLVRGAVVKKKASNETVEVRGKFVVVSDGANSRFGRALGTSRDKSYPLGMAIRSYFNSPKHDDPMIESHLDLRDKDGNVLPGYGWIFPVGDGRINVGVGLLSTFNHWKSVNTTHLMEAFVDTAPPEWGISPDTACGPATGGRLPMAFSVQPNAGPTYLVTGDAAGAINPFNGEGIAYAYETGRLAAQFVGEALTTNDALALSQYPKTLQDTYGLYYKVARVFVKIIGRPEIMRVLANTGMHSRTLMEWILRIMSNMLRPDETGPAEAAYKACERLVRLTPSR